MFLLLHISLCLIQKIKRKRPLLNHCTCIPKFQESNTYFTLDWSSICSCWSWSTSFRFSAYWSSTPCYWYGYICSLNLDLPIALQAVNDILLCILFLTLFIMIVFTPLSRQFTFFVSYVSIPKSYKEAIMYPEWKQGMDEMDAFISRQT